MSHAKYNKEQMNPLNKKWEKTGVALLTDVDVEVLNSNTVHTGIKFTKQKTKK